MMVQQLLAWCWLRFGNRPLRMLSTLVALGTLWASSTAWAQLPQTRLYAVYPNGGNPGASFEMTITSGADLEEVRALLFNVPGIVATPKMNNGQPVPNVFQVKIEPHAPPGRHEVRALGLWGLSNPRTFIVSSLPDVLEVEPNNAREQATPIELNQTIVGKLNPGAETDWFKFTGKAGTRVLMESFAQRIDSRADVALELVDAQGKRVGHARRNYQRDTLLDVTLPADGEYFLKVNDFVFAGGEEYSYRIQVGTGPHIDFVLPPAGAAGTTGQYTLFGRNIPGSTVTDAKLDGRPLERLTVSITLPIEADRLDPRFPIEPYAAGMDAFQYQLGTPQGVSNPVLIYYSPLPCGLEQEPNNDPASANTVAVPGEFAGQFDPRGDVDWVKFEAKQGEVYWIEVIGQRMGNLCDPYFTLDQVTTTDKGEEIKRLTAVDDDGQNLTPLVFDTLSDDPIYRLVVPANATYRLALRHRYGSAQGSPNFVYRLSIRREQPDFRVVAIPSQPFPPNARQPGTWSVNLRRGDNVAVHLACFRKDGFAEPVQVVAEGLPAGVTCREVTIGTAPSSGLLVFTAAEDAPAWAGTVTLVAKAKFDDPAKLQQLAAARATLKATLDSVPNLEKEVAKWTEMLGKATPAVAAAKAELANNPADEGLKKKVSDLEQQEQAAAAGLKTANDAQLAAEQKIRDEYAAVQRAEAERLASAREVMHPVRSGTVVWPGQPNIPGEARISQSLELSVMDEVAPFQIVSDVQRVEAQLSPAGKQIEIPVKVIRRAGFDNAVPLTFVGQPQNVQVENKPIPKEKAEETLKVTVAANVNPGTYLLHLQGQQAVSYRRNPAKLDRAQAAFKEAEKAVNDTAELVKSATQLRDETTAKATAEAENAKKAQAAKVQADKVHTDAQAALKQAEEALKNAGDTGTAKEEAEKKVAEAKTAVEQAAVAAADAEKQRVAAEEASKVAEKAKAAAENDLKTAEAKAKAANDEKQRKDKDVKDAEKATNAANINFMPVTQPIVLTVKPMPCSFMLTLPNGGVIAPGTKMDVRVDLKRNGNFLGPVTVAFQLPAGMTGVTAAPIVIPPERSRGTLVLEAAADAAANTTFTGNLIRGTCNFEGEVVIEHPLTVMIGTK